MADHGLKERDQDLRVAAGMPSTVLILHLDRWLELGQLLLEKNTRLESLLARQSTRLVEAEEQNSRLLEVKAPVY